ncbi:MAG: DUF5979 domain-containing protein [Coriobacteriales bacterium]|jgi:hypothetical protein|nr:DUF5979 domain-containing protein [Coriobacteriales bacterium]
MKSPIRSKPSAHTAPTHLTTGARAHACANTSTGALTGAHTIRKFLCLFLAVLLLTSIATLGSATTALAADDKWVTSTITGTLFNKYGKYHDVPGLPTDFADYAKTQDNQFYYSTIDNHAIYCTEINRHSYYQNPDESFVSSQFDTDDERAFLTYLLAKGQRFFADTEEAVKLYTATQIAVWIAANNLQDNEAMLDLICFPKTGDFADTEGFAPTLEVGRLARTLLEGAKAFVTSGADPSTLLGPFIPSFMSTSEENAPTYTMQDLVAYFGVDLTDTNGVIDRDWGKTMTTQENGGFHLLPLVGNILSVRSLVAPTETKTLKFSGPYGGYELRFLSTDKQTSDGRDFQKMARLARIGDTPLYFKIAAYQAPAQTGNLNLTKAVTGKGDTNKEFSFRATFKTPSGDDVNNILLDGKRFPSGSTLPLKHGATAHFTNIPLGTTYELVEMDYTAAGYTSDKPSNTVKGTVGATDLITVAYTNTYTAPGDPGEPGEPGTPGTPGTPDKPNTPGDTTPKTPGTSYPKTGDGATFNTVALALALLAVLTPAGIFAWRRYRVKQ